MTDYVFLGIAIWLLGYFASIALYFVVPADFLGWILFAIFTPVTAFICFLRFNKRKESLAYYQLLALTWVVIALVFDYLFIVKLLGAIGYYKIDVVVYYVFTFLIPLVMGVRFGMKKSNRK